MLKIIITSHHISTWSDPRWGATQRTVQILGRRGKKLPKRTISGKLGRRETRGGNEERNQLSQSERNQTPFPRKSFFHSRQSYSFSCCCCFLLLFLQKTQSRKLNSRECNLLFLCKKFGLWRGDWTDRRLAGVENLQEIVMGRWIWKSVELCAIGADWEGGVYILGLV